MSVMEIADPVLTEGNLPQNKTSYCKCIFYIFQNLDVICSGKKNLCSFVTTFGKINPKDRHYDSVMLSKRYVLRGLPRCNNCRCPVTKPQNIDLGKTDCETYQYFSLSAKSPS